MRSGIEEEIVPVEEEDQLVMKKHVNQVQIKEKNDFLPKRPKKEPLANVKCLECHCVGTVMKTQGEVVLRPNTVKKTLLDLGGGLFMPNINKMKPTVKIFNQKAKDFVEGFNQAVEADEEDRGNDGFVKKSIKRAQTFWEKLERGIENTRPEKKMKLAEMIRRELVKTPAPEKFTGWLSDEFEKHAFWKSKKRFSLQLIKFVQEKPFYFIFSGNRTMRQLAVYMIFGCFFWGIIVGISIFIPYFSK